jgi:single-stranded DNA-binding protein
MIKNEGLVTVTGWLNDVKVFDWGTSLKVAVDVREKNEQDEWVTVDKTIYEVGINTPISVEGAKQVIVTGRIQRTKTFEKRDGTTGCSIRVKAESVEAIFDDRGASEKVQEAAIMGQWPTATIGQATADAPF